MMGGREAATMVGNGGGEATVEKERHSRGCDGRGERRGREHEEGKGGVGSVVFGPEGAEESGWWRRGEEGVGGDGGDAGSGGSWRCSTVVGSDEKRKSVEKREEDGEEERKEKGRGGLSGVELLWPNGRRRRKQRRRRSILVTGRRNRERQRNGAAVVGLTTTERGWQRGAAVVGLTSPERRWQRGAAVVGLTSPERRATTVLGGDKGEDGEEDSTAVRRGGRATDGGEGERGALGAVLHRARLRARGRCTPRVVARAHVALSGHPDVTITKPKSATCLFNLPYRNSS